MTFLNLLHRCTLSKPNPLNNFHYLKLYVKNIKTIGTATIKPTSTFPPVCSIHVSWSCPFCPGQGASRLMSHLTPVHPDLTVAPTLADCACSPM